MKFLARLFGTVKFPTLYFVRQEGPRVLAVYRIRQREDGLGRTSDIWRDGRWLQDWGPLGKYLAVGFDSDTGEVSMAEADEAVRVTERDR